MKLQIENKVWQKIAGYVDNCQYEIGGMGEIVCNGQDFLVTSAEILRQKVTASHVDMTAETMAQFQVEKIKAGQSVKDYKFWWHSHAKMDVFFSATDTATINASRAEFPWMVSFVTNHKHEMTARLDIYQPVHVHVEQEIEVIDDADQSIIDACIAEIKEKVTMPAIFSGAGYGYPYRPSGWKSPYQLEDEDDTVPTRRTTQTKKDEKKRTSLAKELKKKEALLAKYERIGTIKPSIIDRLEADIASISFELDKFTPVDDIESDKDGDPTAPSTAPLYRGLLG